MNENIGAKIKELRTRKGITLKELSGMTSLSIGFLSQLERGLSTIAIDSLSKVAKLLEVPLSYFIEEPKRNSSPIIKSYDRELLRIDNDHYIYYRLSNNTQTMDMLPELVEILPMKSQINIKSYPHEGEEFVYVLEGVCTLYIDNEVIDLYPGDSAHYASNCNHNWVNNTNKTVRLLTVHTPNMLKCEENI